MFTWGKAAAVGGMLAVCGSAQTALAQTGPRLAWDGQGSPAVTGYAVTIDGVRTNHGLAPLAANGTCGCSILVPFSGGHHTIVVTAYNTAGETPSAPLTVGPIANAGGPYAGVAGTAIAVTAGGSIAPTGNLTNYTWRWGDGSADTSSSSPSASHVYAGSGTFTITLTIRDNAGATATATTTAAVSTVQAPLPAPWLTQDIGSVGLAGSASYSSSSKRFTIAGAGADIWGSADSFRHEPSTERRDRGSCEGDSRGLDGLCRRNYASASRVAEARADRQLHRRLGLGRRRVVVCRSNHERDDDVGRARRPGSHQSRQAQAEYLGVRQRDRDGR